MDNRLELIRYELKEHEEWESIDALETYLSILGVELHDRIGSDMSTYTGRFILRYIGKCNLHKDSNLLKSNNNINISNNSLGNLYSICFKEFIVRHPRLKVYSNTLDVIK